MPKGSAAHDDGHTMGRTRLATSTRPLALRNSDAPKEPLGSSVGHSSWVARWAPRHRKVHTRTIRGRGAAVDGAARAASTSLQSRCTTPHCPSPAQPDAEARPDMRDPTRNRRTHRRSDANALHRDIARPASPKMRHPHPRAAAFPTPRRAPRPPPGRRRGHIGGGRTPNNTDASTAMPAWRDPDARQQAARTNRTVMPHLPRADTLQRRRTLSTRHLVVACVDRPDLWRGRETLSTAR